MYHVELIVRVTSGSVSDTPEKAIRHTREIMLSELSSNVLRVEVVEARAERGFGQPKLGLWALIKLALKRL